MIVRYYIGGDSFADPTQRLSTLISNQFQTPHKNIPRRFHLPAIKQQLCTLKVRDL